MATSLSTNIRLTLSAVLSNALDLVTPTASLSKVNSMTLTNTQAPLIYAQEFSLTQNTAYAIVVTGNEDSLGNSITIGKVLALFVENTGAVALKLGGLNAAVVSGSTPYVELPAAVDGVPSVFLWMSPTGVAFDDFTVTPASDSASSFTVAVIGKTS